MANKRPKPEEIVTKLRQVEVLTGQCMPRLDAIRQIGVTEQTFYRWKKWYSGMGTDQLKELKRLQKENERLRTGRGDRHADEREPRWFPRHGRVWALSAAHAHRWLYDHQHDPHGACAGAVDAALAIRLSSGARSETRDMPGFRQCQIPARLRCSWPG